MDEHHLKLKPEDQDQTEIDTEKTITHACLLKDQPLSYFRFWGFLACKYQQAGRSPKK